MEELEYLEHTINDEDFQYNGDNQDTEMVAKGYVKVDLNKRIFITERGKERYRQLLSRMQMEVDKRSKRNSLGGF